MEKEMKIYHVETQEDYDDLMIELENEGCMWVGRDKPTDLNFWYEFEAETVIYLGSWRKGEMTRGDLSEAKRKYSTIPIIKHKAKGVEQMEKVVVTQFVADWYERTMTPNSRIGDTLKKLKDVTSEEIHLWEEAIGNDYEFWYETAEKTIVRMWLYDYEIKEEKKYYWRKKKEYLFNFEDDDYIYLNIDEDTGEIYFSDKEDFNNFKTLLTETELKQFVREEDFNKLERVEIDAVQ